MRNSATSRLVLAVAVGTALVSVAGLVDFRVLSALRRDGPAISHGQVWRLFTSLLVQDGGVAGTAWNLVGLLAVGIPAQRRLGASFWCAAYLVGGLAGEIAGWAGWQPIGAGNSVAVSGLAGALLVAAVPAGGPFPRWEVMAPLTWTLRLAVDVLPVWFLPTGLVIAGAAVWAERRWLRWVLLALVAGCAAASLAARDIHAAALAVGMVIGLFRLWPTAAETDSRSRA